MTTTPIDDLDVPPPDDADAPIDLSSRRRPEWEKYLSSKENGGLHATANNVELVLSHSPEWRGVLAYDERSDQVQFRSAPPWKDDRELPREIRDVDLGRISIWLERHGQYPILVGPESRALYSAVAILAELHRYDPVKLYLEGLRWDGEPRVDSWLTVYLGADDSPLHAAIGRKWLISAVARTMTPGCQADHILVLVGNQGLKKSSTLRALVGDEWFGDNLPDLKNKDAADYLRGLWVVEMAELDSLSRSEVSTAKAFITRREDRYRAAYARCTATHPRRCVFAGSTNEAVFLRDSTGNRRFWPVSVRRADADALARDRDQIWAEAVHLYRAGEPWWITETALEADIYDAQEERMAADAWEPIIAEWLEGEANQQGGECRIEIGDVLQRALSIPKSDWRQPDQNRVAKVLQRLGWGRKQFRRPGTGKRYYCYVRIDGGQE